MKIEEMKKISSNKTEGKWVAIDDYDGWSVRSEGTYIAQFKLHYPECGIGLEEEDAKFIAMAANNWDKLMKFVDDVRYAHERINSYELCQEALAAVEAHD